MRVRSIPVRRTTPRWPSVLLAFLVLLTLGPRKGHAQFVRFDNLREEQGLGNASVSAIGQDADGYILIGTDSGLFRYDGSTVSPWDKSVGLPAGGFVRRIDVDERGQVWVSLSDGLYVRDGERFKKVDLGSGARFRTPHLFTMIPDGVVADVDGTLVAAGSGPQSIGAFRPLLGADARSALPDDGRARFVVGDGRGTLLFGCGEGLCRYRNGTARSWGEKEGLPRDAWQTALVGSDGTVFVRSLHRLAWLPPDATLFDTASIPGNRAEFYGNIPERLELVQDRSGAVFTQGDLGLVAWSHGRWKTFQHHEGGLSANPLQGLFEDREGSLWAGSIGHGAFRSVGLDALEHWTADDGLPSDLVWAVTRLRDGQMWVATFGDSVSLGDDRRSIPGGSENVIATHHGNLWLMPLHDRLARLDAASGAVDHLPNPGLIASALLDDANRLWLCTQEALLVMPDADAPERDLRLTKVLDSDVLQVTSDRSKRIWAVGPDGIFRRAPDGHFEAVTASLPAGQAAGIATGPADQLWVYTAGFGIIRFRITGDDLVRLPPIEEPVIASNNVMFVTMDSRGWMWVGSDRGLDLFDGTTWRHIDRSDGLLSNDLNQFSVFEDRDGSMWFGSSHGLTHMPDPARLPSLGTLHPIVTDVAQGHRHFRVSPSIRMRWSNAPIAIHIADLDFARGANIVFQYRIDGVDQGWNETTGREVLYAALPAGKLRFALRAVDRAHNVTSSEVGFGLRIEAPWWHRSWFYAVALMAAGASIGIVWQVRVRLLIRQRRRLEDMVGERTREIEEARMELHRQATSDGLTGLANRRAIMALLDKRIGEIDAANPALAVMLCDIDHFKRINDGLGHLAGDAVLSQFGKRLEAILESGEAVGRYGGEEFLILLPRHGESAHPRISLIQASMTEAPYVFGGEEREVTTSTGVAHFHSGDTSLSLLARADAALYDAKRKGRNRVEFERWPAADATADAAGIGTRGAVRGVENRSDDDRAAGARTAEDDLEHDLRGALERDELQLHYQPVVDIVTGTVTSCEALLRWQSPTRGMISPAIFVPLAETAGLMPEIGEWVLRSACRDARGWPRSMKVSVNLSPAQLKSADLIARIEKVLDETGFDRHRLELEVTETAMIGDLQRANDLLTKLRSLGIAIALDDFGTGYSSLSFLKTLPFDRIKIDKSFVQDVGYRPQALAIVRAVSQLCKTLGASVTAEGVETSQQLELVRAEGCREVQGFLIARPCSLADLQRWFRTSRVERSVVADAA